jgi:FkbM family methyltransferase
MLVKNSFLRKKFRSAAWLVFNALENNGNCNMRTNGEICFLKNFLAHVGSRKSATIFDVGANIGNYTNLLHDLTVCTGGGISFHLFEPAQSCYNSLVERFHHHDNFTLNHFGLSNNEEKATIFYDAEKSGLASLYKRDLAHYSVEMNMSEEIYLKRACDYIEEHAVEHIDLLKIDVEGHELKVLEGFRSYLNADFIDYIQFEYGGANLDSHTSLLELYSMLEKKDFAIAKIFPKGLEVRSYQPYMENFMYANYVAISKRVLNA